VSGHYHTLAEAFRGTRRIGSWSGYSGSEGIHPEATSRNWTLVIQSIARHFTDGALYVDLLQIMKYEAASDITST